MSRYGAKELARSNRTVRKNTLQVAQDIPEDKYNFRVSAEMRSVAELLTHIALSHEFNHQLHGAGAKTLEGFDFGAFMARHGAEEKKPRSKAEIVELLRVNGDKWNAWLEGLSDDFLAEQVAMPQGADPASKSRFELILGVKEHEMHHRGQLMLIERILGVVPHLTREREARFAAANAAKR